LKRRAIAVSAAVLVLSGFLILAALAAALGGMSPASPGSEALGAGADGVSVLARSEIPPQYLRLYEQAAQRYGLDWAILAGIGKVECDHGRDPDPSCTREGAVNAAGAGGPMQFLASTWAKYGVDGDGDGVLDRWDPADAIYSAANYLHASGAPGDYRQAIFSYNHASWYVQAVEGWAAKYRGAPTAPGASTGQAPSGGEGGGGEGGGGEGGGGEGGGGEGGEGKGGEGEGGEDGEGGGDEEGADTVLEGESPTPVRFIAGERAELAPGDGHLALVPAGVPASVQAMVVAGNELQGLPYGPGGHPDPRGATEEDCSSTLNYVLYRSGVRPISEIVKDNPLAQDYVSWGEPGPGRWVTIYATASPTPHVFVVIAGLRLDTSHAGTDVGPNQNEDGPRWRVLDHIPTWAHWSVRHPPGL
jgi:transglycosylase-like protein with SLT domain